MYVYIYIYIYIYTYTYIPIITNDTFVYYRTSEEQSKKQYNYPQTIIRNGDDLPKHVRDAKYHVFNKNLHAEIRSFTISI